MIASDMFDLFQCWPDARGRSGARPGVVLVPWRRIDAALTRTIAIAHSFIMLASPPDGQRRGSLRRRDFNPFHHAGIELVILSDTPCHPPFLCRPAVPQAVAMRDEGKRIAEFRRIS